MHIKIAMNMGVQISEIIGSISGGSTLAGKLQSSNFYLGIIFIKISIL